MYQRLPLIGKVGLFTVGLATTWSTAALSANGFTCGMASTVGGGGSGPPSISATEASTTQVLEEIRRRTQVAQQEAQPIPVSDTTVAASAPGSSSATEGQQQATTSAAQTQAAQAANAAKAKSKASAAQATLPTASGYPKYASLKDYGQVEYQSSEGEVTRTRAVWGQGFAGYERHSNLAPGNQENPTRNEVTGGGMVGADWTTVRHGASSEAFQFGVFSGYSETNNRLSSTQFTASVDAAGSPSQVDFTRSDNTEDINGPFVGAYLAYVRDAWTFDLAFKTDFFDLTQRSTLSAVTGCTPPSNVTAFQKGSATERDYVVAAEASRRTPLSATTWFEPTAGIRFTYTDFGRDVSTGGFNFNDAGTGTSVTSDPGTLGLDDGSALRLQIGARYGDVWTSPRGYLLTTTFGAFLYSDVLITGFRGTAGISGESVGPVDEGKPRGLGQITSKLDVGSGLSYLFLAEVYGGQDEVGVDGQLGARYQW